MANYQRPEDLAGENGLLKQLTKALIERVMKVELSTHLGYEKHDRSGYKSGNSRNGKSKRNCRVSSARSIWRCRATGRARLSRRSC